MPEGIPQHESHIELHPSPEEIGEKIREIAGKPLELKEKEKREENEVIMYLTMEATLATGRKMEIVYKAPQRLAREDRPPRIHSVIYGNGAEGSLKGPEYFYEKGEWKEDVMPEDPRGKSV